MCRHIFIKRIAGLFSLLGLDLSQVELQLLALKIYAKLATVDGTSNMIIDI